MTIDDTGPKVVRRRTKWRSRWGMAGVAALAIPMLVTSGAFVSSASVTPKANAHKTIKPDYAFYRGQTINYIVANSAGSTIGDGAAAIAPALGRALGATVNVSYVPGNAIIGANEVAAASPNGLTIGTFNLQTQLFTEFINLGGVNFALLTTSYVGSFRQTPIILVKCAGSKYTTFASLRQATSPVKVLDVAGSLDQYAITLIFHAYNIPYTYVTGFATPAAVGTGCLQGEGDVSMLSAANFTNSTETAMDPGITPLLLAPEIPSTFPDVFLNSIAPSLATFAKKNPAKGKDQKQALALAVSTFATTSPGNVTFGPEGIPAARLLVLTDAMKAADKEAAVKQQLNAFSTPPGLASPTVVEKWLRTEIKGEPFVKTLLAQSS